MMSCIYIVPLLLCLNLVFCVELIPESKVVKYNISKEVTLQCNVKGGQLEGDLIWKKGDVNVIDITTLKNKLTFKNTITNGSISILDPTEDDAGNYTCSGNSNGQEMTAHVFAATTIHVNTPENVNVVEGEKLRILCNANGKPPPEIVWTIGEANYTNSSGVVTLQEDPDKKIPNAVLLIENINMTDRGIYKCIGYSKVTDEMVEDEAMVRVKDKYAALWPFLGICLEVFVLCAIILIYEKKRNKSELEESDTDQSPDQKNTPDNGKESNLRHRQ